MNKYIHQIIRKLKCSKVKREEIKKQLTADFMGAEENGEKPEDIIKRMGNPSEIAEEFNSSFPASELKKYKKEKWIRRSAIGILILLLLAAVVYWILPKTKPVEDGGVFKESEVRAQAEAVIQSLSGSDYESLRQYADEKMSSVLTDDFLEKAKDNFGPEWGEFRSYGNIYSAQVTQMGKTYAVVQVNASFEKVSITFNISFDQNMKLAGLYMK